MTIKYTRFAIIPERCDECHRKFWLEPYDIFYRDIGILGHSCEMIKCKKCVEKSESEENNG